jgi:hypothetical protein
LKSGPPNKGFHSTPLARLVSSVHTRFEVGLVLKVSFTQSGSGLCTPLGGNKYRLKSGGIMNHQLVEIASWRVVSELYRRYPGKFKIIETHPGGGQYDCLGLYDERNQNIADFNRNGSLHLPRGRLTWQEILDASDSKKMLDNICQMMGFPKVENILPSTPTTLVYRFIATFLTHATFGIHRWECRNGYEDTSGYGGGVVSDFEGFPSAQERCKVKLEDDILKQPAYRFWFLRKEDKPLLCLETVGLLWIQNDLKTYNLMDLYNHNNRHIWLTVVSVAGALMP